MNLREDVLGCNECDLRTAGGCTAPVAWSGPDKADVMFFGEKPAPNEDKHGVPWSGYAGKELDNYIWQQRWSRDMVRVDNVVRCHPPDNRDATASEIKACTKWTMLSIAQCNPKVIVPMGGPAVQVFMGNVNVDDVHGIPVKWGNHWVFPMYNPAYGMRQTREMHAIQRDFLHLKMFMEGNWWPPTDNYPDPVYKLARDKDLDEIAYQIKWHKGTSTDTENTPDGKIWCASFCYTPGEAWVVWPQQIPYLAETALNDPNVTITMHQAVHDLDFFEQVGVRIDPSRLLDTMIMAYLLGEPQGLKEGCRRHCGMQMKNYTDMVNPYQAEMSYEFFRQGRDWTYPSLQMVSME